MPAIHTDIPGTDGTGAPPSPVRRFGRVPARWLDDPGIGVDELAVLAALAVHADRDGVCVVRQRTLAGLLRRSREWVCRVLARLCEPGGFVFKEHRADRDGWNLACRYRLPDLAAPEDGRAGSPAGVARGLPGNPAPGPSGSGAGGAARNGGDDLAGAGDPVPADPAASAPAVTAPAPADMTGGAHREQTSLNRDSPDSATLRCAGCHCRERPMGGPGAADGGADRSRLVPADWRPDAGDLAWLERHRPDLDAGHMAAVFVCGSRARGLRYADCSAAWRRWALAERDPGRRPTASAAPPPRFHDAPRPMPPTGSEHHAAQEARNEATGEAVLARMMARRGAFSGIWMGG